MTIPMTTASTNEMLALADLLEKYKAGYKGGWAHASPNMSWGDFDTIITALRLAATPARDVREALELFVTDSQLMRDLRRYFHTRNQGMENWLEDASRKADAALSNLDAAAPASGGDVEPVAWRWHWNFGDEPDVWAYSETLVTSDKDKTAEPLYTAPPLQAPAHSDTVRDMPPTQEYVLRAMVKNYADGNLWDHLDREVCTKAADEIKSLRAALAATAEKAGDNYAVADQIIGQIEERFPNWQSYRDLIDCIDCTLHDLRSGDPRFATPTPPSADVQASAVSEADVGAAEIAGLVTAAAKVIADWSADCKVDDDSIVALLTAYNAMKPCGVLLLNEVEGVLSPVASTVNESVREACIAEVQRITKLYHNYSGPMIVEALRNLDLSTLTAPAAKAPAVSEADVGRKLIEAERARQISEEGWSTAHDDTHDDGQLLHAGMCYLSAARSPYDGRPRAPMGWPWTTKWWKPSTPERNFVKAGALLIAERDRLVRAGRSHSHIDHKIELTIKWLNELIQSAAQGGGTEGGEG